MAAKRIFDRAEALSLNLEGLSDAAIGKRLGVNQGAISAWRRAEKVPMRRRCWGCGSIFTPATRQRTHCGECGLRRCSSCKEVKPFTDYSPNSHTPDKINNVCKPCIVLRQGPHYSRYRRNRYGLTAEGFMQLWQSQGGRCAICLDPLALEEAKIDHAHSHCANGCRECLRGLAHHGCNVGIGFFLENPVALRNAANYVERFGS